MNKTEIATARISAGAGTAFGPLRLAMPVGVRPLP